MPQLDKLKEEIGWLKVAFAILVATNLSLIAYFAQNYKIQSFYFSIINGVAIMLLALAIILINKVAYKKINEIGEL